MGLLLNCMLLLTFCLLGYSTACSSKKATAANTKKIQEMEKKHQEMLEKQRKRIAEMEEALKRQYKRLCPDFCVGMWTPWSTCSARCGGGKSERTRKLYPTLPDCTRYGFDCKKYNHHKQEKRVCNNHCFNGGISEGSGQCVCKPGYKGQCCSQQKFCPSFTTPEFGKFYGPSPAGHRAKVNFACNPGYKLKGNREITCSDGSWIGQLPTCERITCPAPNKRQEVTKAYEYKSQAYNYTTGDEIYYSCGKGSLLTGSEVLRCVETTGGRSRWTGRPPSCTPVSCGQLEAPQNGLISADGIQYNDLVNFTCNKGFKLVGAESLKCLSSGDWLGRTPTCQKIKCDQPLTPRNGDVFFHRHLGMGAQVEFECEPGYLLVGEPKLVCTDDGIWDHPEPQCKAIDCGDPGTPEHGDKDGGLYTLGSKVTYKCYDGYQLNGAKLLTCREDGEWDNVLPVCEACPRHTYKDETIDDGICVPCPSHTATASDASKDRNQCLCIDGYEGTPGGPCIEINCPPQSAPENGGVHNCSDLGVGSTCSFTCDDGYVMQGSSLRTCQRNSKWDGTAPICTACLENTYKSSISTCTGCPAQTSTFGKTAQMKEGCECVGGYQGPLGGPCEDVNECELDEVFCDDECRNTIGSYDCRCNTPGYKLDEDGKSCIVKNQCRNLTHADAPMNGGLVCHWYHEENAIHCQTKCNAGFEFPSNINNYETCGSTTGWVWSYQRSDPNALLQPCFKQFFEGIRLEADAAYFATACHNLTQEQQLQVRQKFVKVLNDEKVCFDEQTQEGDCEIKDTGIICGKTSVRRKRSVDGAELELETMDLTFDISAFQIYDAVADCKKICDRFLRGLPASYCTKEMCVSVYRQYLKAVLKKARTRLENIFENSKNISSLDFDVEGYLFETIPGMLKTSEDKVNCPAGMEAINETCVPCNKGSFLNSSTGVCELCPTGTSQIINGQTECEPCSVGFYTPEPGSLYCVPCDDSHYGINCEEECSCVHGDCDYKTGQCSCHSGYEGDDCTVDIPGCRDNECYPGVQCRDVPAPGSGFTCGPCPPGYHGDGLTCTLGGGGAFAMRVEL